MKKLIIIFIILLSSCSKETECSCDKTYYKIETSLIFVNGIPESNVWITTVGSEKVVCQDEQTVNTGGFTYYEIKCN